MDSLYFIRMQQKFFLIFFLFTGNFSKAQNSTIKTYENIGWYNYFGTHYLNKKWSLHTEYQWRRNKIIKYGQQSLLRVGVNYTANANVLFRVGYAWIETYPYGDITINVFGKDFTEHRLFEMLLVTHKTKKLEWQHRFMLEQRWVGKYSSSNLSQEDDFPLLHRFRYMIRWQMPFKGSVITDKSFYAAAYDELFIGFGKQVVHNTFDQNRAALLIGYKHNKNFRVEAGYINQQIQFGRKINQQAIFQINNGVLINMYINTVLH